MRRKIQRHRLARPVRQLLLDLRRMPVAGYPVSLAALIDLTVQIIHLSPSSGPGYPGLGVNDQGVRVNKPFFNQRIDGQCGTGRITPRIGHQPGLLNIFPVQFRQPVHGLPDKLRRRVRKLVPLLIHRHILNPKIRA